MACNKGMDRRDFLASAAQATVSILLFNASSSHAFTFTTVVIQTVTIDLTNSANSALMTAGGSLYVTTAYTPALTASDTGTSYPLIVVRVSPTVVTALFSECPHKGCTIQLPGTSSFAAGTCGCLCHGSEFDVHGNLVQGPATMNLQTFSATLSGTTITITNLAGTLPGQELGDQALRVTYAQDARTLELVFPDPLISYRIRLFDLSGKVLLEKNISQSERCLLQLYSLEKGAYILEVTSSRHTFNYRFSAF